jgi:hypothetical protein
VIQNSLQHDCSCIHIVVDVDVVIIIIVILCRSKKEFRHINDVASQIIPVVVFGGIIETANCVVFLCTGRRMVDLCHVF